MQNFKNQKGVIINIFCAIPFNQWIRAVWAVLLGSVLTVTKRGVICNQ